MRSLNADAVSYRRFRYPAEIISHCVWLYHRFPLSFREIEEMMLARGVVVSHETIRQWSVKFGAAYAAGLRRRRPKAGDNWHLDEVFIKVNGQRQYLWRAVDQDGNVLDILVQSRRNTKAAKRFLAKLMKRHRQLGWRPGGWDDRRIVCMEGRGGLGWWAPVRRRTRGSGFQRRSSTTASGCTTVSRSASARSKR